MRLFNTQGATSVEKRPFDPSDPETPADFGFMSQDAGSPAYIYPHHMNDLAGELVRLIQLSVSPKEIRDQLRQLFHEVELPPTTALAMVDQVAPADIAGQTGFYKRAGKWVDLQVDLEWGNTNVPITAEPLRVVLPYLADQRAVGRLSLTLGTFQNDDPGAPPAMIQYEPVILGPGAAFFDVRRVTNIGQLPVTSVTIGDTPGTDAGNRKMVANIRYNIGLAALRNTAWPLLERYSLTWPKISDPDPVNVECRYDGAIAGSDVIQLLNGALAVVDTFNVPVGPPSGVHPFLINVADTYRFRIPRAGGLNFDSAPFTVDP